MIHPPSGRAIPNEIYIIISRPPTPLPLCLYSNYRNNFNGKSISGLGEGETDLIIRGKKSCSGTWALSYSPFHQMYSLLT